MSRPDTTDGIASPAEVLATLTGSGWTRDDIEAHPWLAPLLAEEGRP